MKVLIVTKTKDGGGTERHVAEIVARLKGRIDIDAAYLEDGLWSLCDKIQDSDIVHFFLPRPYVIGSFAAFGKVRIMSRRSLTECYQTPLLRFIEKLLHRRTRILVGNSPAVIEQLRAEAPKADIRLIRNGVAAEPNAFKKTNGVFQMICVANAFVYKGHEDLLAAIRQIGPQLPEPWNLWLVGRGTEKYTSWRVTGLGYRTDIATLLESSDLFILPSHEEGSSNALLEAMAAGVPVIATQTGGNADAVIPGITGVLVPVRSPAALGAAILAMAANPDMRAKMAKAARQDVARRFTWDRCIDDYEALYHSALEGAGTVHSAVYSPHLRSRQTDYR